MKSSKSSPRKEKSNMSDGSLSQDEIDALLQGSGGFDLPGVTEAPVSAAPPAGAGAPDMGAFAEYVRGFSSSQGATLSSMIGTDVSLGEPTIEIISNGTFVSSLPAEVVQIVLNFSGGAAGDHSYLFSSEIATTIAGLMMGQEGVELNEAALSALEEAGNTMAGGEATAMSDKLGVDVGTMPGQSRTVAASNVEVPVGEFAKVTYPVTIVGQGPTELIELFDMALVQKLSGSGDAPMPGMDSGLGGGLFDGGGMDDQSLFGGAMEQPAMAMGANPNVQSVQFPALGGGVPAADQGNIGLLMDVYMEMTVELGRTRKLIRDILGMGEGTIIELDKLAGEPVDILVNHKLIAKGEVVVIDENFGVRVTEIVDPMDRVSEM
jgi:flagellar motor switch protein FliN